MNRLTEALMRKAWNYAFRLRVSQPAATGLPAHYSDIDVRFTERFYPYHFLTPELLDRQLYFNKDGIPVRYLADTRSYTNPVYPAYYGLVCLNTDGDQGLSVALNMAEFLLAESQQRDDVLLWQFETTLPRYHLHGPFRSGLAQGLCASLFVRLHVLTQSHQWLAAAKAAIRGMLLPLEQGGALRRTPEGLTWIEEYPGEVPSFVLNGFLFALIALLEVQHFTADTFSVRQEDLLQSLMSTFPLYRRGHYLFYDRLHFKLCNPQYMGLHTMLFYHLFRTTGLDVLLDMARDLHRDVYWNLYMLSFNTRLTRQQKAWLQAELGS